MSNIMLDLETLGTVITQIGAVYFDWAGKTGETFLVNVNIKSCLDKGLEIKYKELKFWLENKDRITWDKDTIPLTKALEELTAFCKIDKKAYVWSHFYDIEILESVCQKLGQKLPFHYTRWRDIRTLVFLAGLKREEKSGDPKTHNALDDCLYQVNYCCKAYRLLETKLRCGRSC